MQQDAYTLPAAHALEVAELVKTWEISQEQLFEGLDVARAALERPEARISLTSFIALIERARSLTGEPALGFHIGLRTRIPSHGFLGFAAMTASNLREALELAVRYAPTRTNALKLELRVSPDEAALYVDELADLGSARDCILLALTVGLWQIGEALTGQKLHGHADFAFDRPDYAERFEKLAFGARYGQPRTCLRFAAEFLSAPLGMANPSALNLARAQCELALDALDSQGLVARVRELLPREASGFHSLAEVAAKLGFSSRTLKRKLKAEGSVFSEVLDQLAIEQARELLRSPTLSVEQIAERMGYSDVSNFGRAFRRWTGTTPAGYRRDVEAR